MRKRLFTSESVGEGHPDKIADQISDAVLDAVLSEDPESRVACETLVTTGLVLVAGEISTKGYVEIPEVVRGVLGQIGYTNSEHGIDARTCGVLVSLDRQSPDIAQGVDTGGAGDQGMMFGYAADETDVFMPAPIVFAHRLVGRLAAVRHNGEVPWLRPDGKAQVTMEYDGDEPRRIDTVVLSAQHDPGISSEELHQTLIEKVIVPALPGEFLDPDDCVFHINPTGSFVVGGPQGDAGLTGRKIIVDTYGGMGRHGGGAFSGKDSTKVDRSAAYAARWAAKNLVAAGAARRCEIQLAYAIGVAEPVSVHVDAFGTGAVSEDEMVRAVNEVFDLRPSAIIERLRLQDPIFSRTAVLGHFGRTSEETVHPTDPSRTVRLFPWEATDHVKELRTLLKL